MKRLIVVVSLFVGIGGIWADTSLSAGSWQVRFADADARLELAHPTSGARISGRLTFAGPAAVTGSGEAADATKTAAWKVTDARDGAKRRLALVDPRDNVNGYVTFQGDGDRVSMLVCHRTAFAYGGRLRFEADVAYRADAFSCRLTPKANDRVLAVKSGAAVSADDDALFSAAADEALHFTGGRLTGTRLVSELVIDDPTRNALTCSVDCDYYKSRWVPYYRPLDRRRAPHAPTGWLSWNTYFDQAGSKENLDEARFAAKWFKPFGMEIWNIESWQDNSPHLPVSDFHNMNLETYKVQFPEGMKWLADEIRKLGFRPGLWMAPYGTGSEAFYAEHKDWFLHDAAGKPIRSWNGRFTLDPTAPGALEHLTKIFDKASHDWGYEFFKIDGMSGRNEGYCAHLYERPGIRARFHDPSCQNPFERTVAAFRKGIGEDRLFLACQGHFTGAEAAYADSSRTGADIVHPNQPVTWSNIRLQARCTVNQIFAHSVVFWSDPDCMLVSQGALAREQAQVEATVVALPGQQTFAGDKLAELAPDRVRLIQQALPVCDTHPAKLYPQFGHLPVWDLHVARPFGDWHVVALFNWDEEEKTVGVDWTELGEAAGRRFIGWEYWTGTYLGARTGRLEMKVPAHAVRLVALQPDLGRPQFLSSDRHVTQGGVELLDQTWQDRTLTAKLKVVGGFPLTATFAVPEGFVLKEARADGVALATTSAAGGRILSATLRTAETKDVVVRLSFASATAGWITHPDMANLKPRNVLSRQLESKRLAPVDTRFQNRHYLFRRSFELETVRPTTLRITADDYYKLYVNGTFVAMGPAAGTTDCTYYNVIDLTPYLSKGRNTLAVHTYYQGLVNRVWVSGDNRHGLWLELDADGRRILASDETFKVTRHTGYAAMGKAGYDTQFLERYDAGASEVGFERPDYDDAAWVPAVRHPLGGDYRLVEQPSPMVVTESIVPVRTERLEKGGLRIDFGGVYVGGVTFAASGKKGAEVEIRCGQELAADGSVRHKMLANCDYVEKMVLSGGSRDILNQFDYKSFRYLELLPAPDVRIDADSVRLVARHQPFELKAKPSFADPALKPVWDLCVDSFRYGVQEQIMDCMDREKGYYLGDGCYTLLANCLLTQNWRQSRKFFDDFLRTKKIDRGLVTCANCSFMQEIAEYPFMMILLAHWYLEQTGDAAFVSERFAALADVVDSYRERYARPDGLLVNLDKWCVVEWPRNFQDDYDADVREWKVCTDVHNVINAWYVIAVRSLNAISARLGRAPYADVKPLEAAFRAVFWDKSRHLFVDREGSRHVSLPGNVYATFARLAPQDDADAHAAFLTLVKEKGYSSISLFQFFPLFCYLRTTGEEALLHELLVSPDAWLRNLREGATRTFEGWGRDTKWNTSLFHLTIASAAIFLTDTRLSLP